MSFFCFLMVEYSWRRSKDRPFHKVDFESQIQQSQPLDRHMKMLIFSIIIPTAVVYIRSVYRIIEFFDGFDGSIAHNQVTFSKHMTPTCSGFATKLSSGFYTQ